MDSTEPLVGQAGSADRIDVLSNIPLGGDVKRMSLMMGVIFFNPSSAAVGIDNGFATTAVNAFLRGMKLCCMHVIKKGYVK